MAIRRNTVLLVVAIAAILLAALILVIPALVNFDRYRPQVISYLQEKTGKQVEIARLTLTSFPAAIHIDDFGVKNPPPFPPGYVVKVARIDAVLDVAALLHRQVVIESIVLDEPYIDLISDPDGSWNFENPQARVSQKVFPLGVIAKLEIKRGQVLLSNLLPSDAPGPVFFEARDISSELQQVNLMAITNPASSSVDGLGTLQAGRLHFGSVHATNVNAKLRLEARQAFLTDVTAEAYGGKVAGDLAVKFTGKSPSFRANARVHGIEMAHLLEAFPSARGKITGKMEGDLKLAGEIAHSLSPLAGLRGAGHVTLRDGEVPSLQLNANLMKLVRFNDLGPAKENPSSFNRISTDLELANLRIISSAIDIDGYGVDIDGSGSVSLSGSDELDYSGTAQITTKQGFLVRTFGRLEGATVKDGKLSFPFRIGGTLATPLFSKGSAHQ
jgi:uncharacterized protein involved in outer membrane biogenesis